MTEKGYGINRMSESETVKFVRDNISLGRGNTGWLIRRSSECIDTAWDAESMKEQTFVLKWKKKEQVKEIYYKYWYLLIRILMERWSNW